MMERPEFISELEAQFPEAFARIDKYESGNLHTEMGAFRDYIEQKMEEGAFWYCERAFQFIERCLKDAGPELKNAIEISFIEDLALGIQNKQRYDIVKQRAPRLIRDKMIQAHNFWK
jgi:hypothetical protein